MAERVCGVYRISFRNDDGHFYIGSSVNVSDRRYRHLVALKKQKHNNPILQRIYNKHGENNLVFETIETVADATILAQREQFYIDCLRPNINILKNAYNLLGYKHTDEAKKKLSLINIGKKMTAEQNLKNSLAQKGNKNRNGYRMTDANKQFLRELKQRKVTNVVSGSILNSIGELAILLNIKYSTMYAKLSGHNRNDTDWRFCDEP